MGPPGHPGATPMRTPRDSFALNTDGDMQLLGATPRDIRLYETSQRNSLRKGLASLPRPKDTEWELELPDEQQESIGGSELSEEDAELRDRREREAREAQEKLDFSRRTRVMQKGLPRPTIVDTDALLIIASQIPDPASALIAHEAALLQGNDAEKYPLPGVRPNKAIKRLLPVLSDDALAQARLLIDREIPEELANQGDEIYKKAWNVAHKSSLLPGLSGYGDDEEIDEQELLSTAFDVSGHSPARLSQSLTISAESSRNHHHARHKRQQNREETLLAYGRISTTRQNTTAEDCRSC